MRPVLGFGAIGLMAALLAQTHTDQRSKEQPSQRVPVVQGQVVGQTGELPAEFEAVLSGVYPHGLPIVVAEGLSQTRGSFEFLDRVLKAWDKRAKWENATLVMGLTGDVRAFMALLDFLRRDDSPAARCPQGWVACGTASPQLSADVYYAKANVPIALGLLLNRLGERSNNLGNLNSEERERLITTRTKVLEYLFDGARAGAASWPDVTWRAEMFPENLASEMYLDLSLQCIEGLAVSGDEHAFKRLQELAGEFRVRPENAVTPGDGREASQGRANRSILLDEGDSDSVHTTVLAAMRQNRKIKEYGIKRYYSTTADPTAK